MSLPLRRPLALTAALLIAVGSAACSISSDSRSSESSSSSTSSAASTAEETTEAPAAQATVPEGYTLTAVGDSGISLALPAHWTVMDSSTLADPAAIQAKLNEAGSSYSAELIAAVAQADFYALDLTGTSNVPATAYAVPLPTPELPDEEALAAGISVFNGTPGEFTEVTTPLGDAVTLGFTSEQQAADGSTVTFHGAQIALPTPAGTYELVTVLTQDAAQTQEIADAITSSAQAS